MQTSTQAKSIFDDDPLLQTRQKAAYPNLKQTWLLLPVWLGFAIVTIVFIYFYTSMTGKVWEEQPLFTILISVIWLTAIFLLAYSQKSKAEPGFKLSAKFPPVQILLLLLLIVPSSLIACIGILEWLQVPLWSKLTSYVVGITAPTPITYISYLLIFPVMEEILYRGIILDGLLKSYSPRKAILNNALFIGVLCLDPTLMIVGFLGSLLHGWMYYKTHNISLNIYTRMLFNLFPILVVGATDRKDPGGSLEELLAGGDPVIVAVSLLVLGISLFLLHRILISINKNII
ncbi:type II CAAX endopeptidase family protein [Chitinophaga sp. MM2321]|uniref:CPBP family intramembrane glutamic endopeptidase n=1 Tax=Chitinophaga sp. MM2321 TaxID=3137178 RepID=UPI0032D585C4